MFDEARDVRRHPACEPRRIEGDDQADRYVRAAEHLGEADRRIAPAEWPMAMIGDLSASSR